MSADVFADHVVLTVHSLGRQILRILRRDGAESALDVGSGDPAASIALWRNEDPDATEVTVVVESWIQPPIWFALDLVTGDRHELKREEAPGHDVEAYVSERISVKGADGVEIPVTVSRRRDVPLDGTAPCLLYGYGAYESSALARVGGPASPPCSTAASSMRCAHIRGGGEMGRGWWLDGHLATKQHTFDDHIAVADALADGLVDGSRIVTRGLSAGGLLQGAVFSQRPDRWRRRHRRGARSSMSSPRCSTRTCRSRRAEWDEWGDPRKPEEFAWMLAYSPYDNLPPAGTRTDLLVTGAVHDPRVMYFEPAKWVAALRESDPDVVAALPAADGDRGRRARRAERPLRPPHYEAEVLAWALERFDPEGYNG